MTGSNEAKAVEIAPLHNFGLLCLTCGYNEQHIFKSAGAKKLASQTCKNLVWCNLGTLSGGCCLFEGFFLLSSTGTPNTLIFLSVKNKSGLNMPCSGDSHSCSSLPLLCSGEANLGHTTFILLFCQWAPKLVWKIVWGQQILSLLHYTLQHIFCCRSINRAWLY